MFDKAINAVLIDLDGTLVDTLGDFELVLGTVLSDLGLPSVSHAWIANTVGRGSENLVRSMLTEVGAPELFDQAWGLYQKHYLAFNGMTANVYPGVVEGLSAMQSRGLPMICLTNKPLAFALPLLELKGLRSFFHHVFGGDSFERKKPDPLPLVRSCETLHTLPHRTLMVGDSSNDALAARGAGCPVVLMRYGYNHGQSVEDVDCDAKLHNFLELIPLLNGQYAAPYPHTAKTGG